MLLDEIEDGHFEYRTLDDQGEMADWSDKWDDPGVTPLMVRIVVRMSAEARIQFPDMEIPLMLDVGARARWAGRAQRAECRAACGVRPASGVRSEGKR